MGFLEERDLSNVLTIPDFFKGKNVFITGGSGFMGKVLIEKLLYSCTDLDMIYLLLRSKKGVNPNDRLKGLYSLPCFDRLRKERPGIFESKVAVVAGDIGQPGLGLSKGDHQLIVRKVNIVFHVAANIRFNYPLSAAAVMNMQSAIEIIEICKKIEDLKVLVHVSTAYANTKWDPVEETMFPPYANWRNTLEVCKNIDEKTLQYLTPKYLGDIPNTYIFTKQLAEHIVYEQRGKLPIVITRPSIVMSSLAEPIPGWIENFNGPIGIFAGAGTGVLRCIYSKKDCSADYIHVDGCIRHFIAAAWIRGTKKLEPSDDIEIYNCCSRKKVTNKQIVQYGKEIVAQLPIEKALWTLHCTLTTSKCIYYFKLFLYQLVPALLVDLILRVSGKKPMLLKIQRKIFIANTILQKFMLHEWTFKVDNFLKLRSCLKEEDVQDFYFDFKNLMTREYFIDLFWGGKIYLLKDKEENLPKARAHRERINMADKILRYAARVFVIWAVVKFNVLSHIYQKIF